VATRGLEARPVHQNRLYDFVTQSFSLYLVVYNGDGVGAKEPWWQYGERMTASRPLFLIGANSHRQWGWRTPRWFGDGCRRRDLLAHELSSTGLGASVPHAVLGEAIRQGCSGTPLGTGRVFSAYGRPPWDCRALGGSSFFVLALVVFLVAVPSRGPFAVLLASWLFSATRALVLSDRRRAQPAARGVIAAVEPGAGRPTPAHTSEKDDPLAQNPTRLARSLQRQMSTTGSWVGLWLGGP